MCACRWPNISPCNAIAKHIKGVYILHWIRRTCFKISAALKTIWNMVSPYRRYVQNYQNAWKWYSASNCRHRFQYQLIIKHIEHCVANEEKQLVVISKMAFKWRVHGFCVLYIIIPAWWCYYHIQRSVSFLHDNHVIIYDAISRWLRARLQ